MGWDVQNAKENDSTVARSLVEWALQIWHDVPKLHKTDWLLLPVVVCIKYIHIGDDADTLLWWQWWLIFQVGAEGLVSMAYPG